ncbi:MAG: glycoside hydrolase family 3 C-terminal domain-containing protein [Bacilli bacterium]|nr:glycoside hydrolase family 3 C-terminal domain-containing protein [Bacilli bacterium]
MKFKHLDIIKNMTLEQKASLMSGKDFWQTQEIEELGIPSIFLADGPNGIRKQMAAADHLGLNESIKATCFPTSCSVASTWNKELAYEEGKRLSKEAKYQKVNVLLGPGVNIKRDPRCGRNFEYFSEDPYLAGQIAANLVKGIQTEGNSACLKHFACNSQELRRMNVDSIVDERALREIYLTQFEIAIKLGKPKTIMSSYNLINGEYANENHHTCNDILRGEWGFDGMMVSDWGGVDNRVEGIKTGNDLEMPFTAGDTNKDIVEAVKSGKLAELDLDRCVDRVLDVILSTSAKLNGENEKPDLQEHHEFAKKVAEEAIVLLENDGVLPIKSKEKVAFIGKFCEEPRYQGAGSSVVNSYKVDKILDFQNEYKFDFVGYEPGFTFKGKIKKGLEKKAIKLAKKSDTVVLFVGLDKVTEAEGMDRKDLKIPQNQLHLVDEILKLGKKVIAIIYAGSVVEIPFAKKVNGLIHAYLLGQAGAKAVLDVIEGTVNPSGRLAESYPFKLEDCPSFDTFHEHPNYVRYKESIYVGYRYYEKADIPVLYPFGYGLSYSKFAYTDFEIDKNGVKVTVKNISEVDGKEVVQLYIGKNESCVYRPVKELKGFEKVFIKAGESAEVYIPFDEFTFRYFNVKTNKFEIEDGEYQIYICGSLKDVKLTGHITFDGTTDEVPYNKNELPHYFNCDIKNVDNNEFEKVLGYKIPDHEIKFYKKNRIVVDYWTTVEYLKYSKRWAGRFFAWAIRFVINVLSALGNKETANTLIMGVLHEPMRGLSRMTGGAIHWKQLDGLIMVFNGHFFKGFHKFFKEGRIIHKEEKASRKKNKRKK